MEVKKVPVGESELLLPPSVKEKLLTGGAWAFLGKIISVAAGLGVNVLLVRLLTHQEMGAYFLTLSFVSLAAVVATLGLTQTVVRLISESMGTGLTGRAVRSVYIALRIATVSGLTVACMLAFGGGKTIADRLFHSSLMSQVMGLAAVWVVLLLFQQLIAEIYRGFHDIKLATLFGGVLTSVLSMALFLALWLGYGHSNLTQVLSVTLVAISSSLLVSGAVLKRSLSRLPPKGNGETRISEILLISWPLWVTNLTIFALTQADLLVMGIYRPPGEVAVYGVVAKMVGLVGIPLSIVNAVVSPLISGMYFQGEIAGLERTLRTASTFGSLPAIFAVMVFIIAGGPVLGIIFGDYYRSGGVIFTILSIGQLLNILTGSCGMALMMTGHQVTMMLITVVTGVLSVIAAVLLVKSYAGEGVAASAALGLLIQNGAALFFVRSKIGVWTHIDLRIFRKVLFKWQIK